MIVIDLNTRQWTAWENQTIWSWSCWLIELTWERIRILKLSNDSNQIKVDSHWKCLWKSIISLLKDLRKCWKTFKRHSDQARAELRT